MSKTEWFRLILGTLFGMLLLGSVPVLAPLAREFLADRGMVFSDDIFNGTTIGLLFIILVFYGSYAFNKLIPAHLKKPK
jgi:hypothetical protein